VISGILDARFRADLGERHSDQTPCRRAITPLLDYVFETLLMMGDLYSVLKERAARRCPLI
jgi:hypothetical protein